MSTAAFRVPMKRTVTGLFLALVLSCTLAAPLPAKAQFIVSDPTNLIQNTVTALNSVGAWTLEYVLEPLQYAFVNTVIDSIKQSTINWARNGFKGKPSFVTDIKRNLRDLQDAVTNQFFYELEAQGMVSSPFLTQVAVKVRDNYYRGTQEDALAKLTLYTLDGVCAEHEAFLAGDFAACGIEGWIQSWRNPWNNPLGAQMSAENYLAKQLASAVVDRAKELEFGSGFLSKRECTPKVECAGDDYACHAEQQKEIFGGGVSLSTAETDHNCKIVTPGAVIHGQLESVLGADIARLVSADELNEIISIIAANLVSGTLNDLLNDDEDEDPAGKTVSPSISTNFLNAIEQQLRSLDSFQKNWSKIRAAAAQAEERLEQCGSRADDEDIASINSILTEADTALAKGAGAMSTLTEFRARVVAARNQAQFQALSTEYQTILSSSEVPSAAEFARATQESINIPEDQGEETLYSKALRIGRTSCSIFNNDGD